MSEDVIRNHTYAFEGWATTTNDVVNKYNDLLFAQKTDRSMHRPMVDNYEVSDYSRRKVHGIGLFGVSPFMQQAIENDVFGVSHSKYQSQSFVQKAIQYIFPSQKPSVIEDLYSIGGT
jgi:hypothetical protein